MYLQLRKIFIMLQIFEIERKKKYSQETIKFSKGPRILTLNSILEIIVVGVKSERVAAARRGIKYWKKPTS